MKKVLTLVIDSLTVLAFITYMIYKDEHKIIKHPFINNTDKIEVKVNSGDSLNSIIDNLSSDKRHHHSFRK
jgi:cell division protein YceG involved in septum cleavage